MRKEPMKIGDLLKKYNLLVLLIVFIVIASILSPNFLTIGNVLNLLQQASIPGIVAIGMTLVIIISGIDLSVGSVAAFAGMISAILVSKNVPIIIAVLAGVVLGAALLSISRSPKVSLSSQLFFLTELSMQKNNRMMKYKGCLS